MEKLLALVLALVMTLGLATVGANATSFSDDSTITYKEAADVMSAIGVFDGQNGAFNPTGNLTREQGAKIVSYMLMGKTAGDAMTTSTAPFDDVAADRWSAGSIAYCVSQGIIGGVGGNKFNPEGELTGAAFAKMLLCALGYDAKIEGFGSDTWVVNVTKTALSAGVLDDLETLPMNGSITRETAAKLAFNALLSTMVEYESKGTTVAIGDAQVVVGTSNATPIWSTKTNANTFKASERSNSVVNSYTLQFAEQYFPNLSEDNTVVNGLYGRSFSYKSNTVSDFGETGTVLATKAAGDAYASLVNTANSKYIGKSADDEVTFYFNDTKITSATDTNNSSVYLAGTYLTSNTGLLVGTNDSDPANNAGVVVNFIDTDGNGKYDVVTYTMKNVAKVTGTPVSTTSGAVTLTSIPGVLSNHRANNLKGDTDLAKGDVILYYTKGANSNNPVNVATSTIRIEKAESFTGTVTAYATKLTVDATAYAISELTGVKDWNTNQATTSAAIYNAIHGVAGATFYKDNGGNLCYYASEKTADSAENIVYVEDADYTGYTMRAKAIMADGVLRTITIDKIDGNTANSITTGTANTNYNTAGYIVEHTFYTYKQNSDGTYSLTSITPTGTANAQVYIAANTGNNGPNNHIKGYTAGGNSALLTGTSEAKDVDSLRIRNGNTRFLQFDDNGTTHAYDETSTLIGTANTVFVLAANGSTTRFGVSTGVANVANYTVTEDTSPATGALAVLTDSDGYALMVVAESGTGVSAGDKGDVVFVSNGPTTVYNDGDPFYVWAATVNGAIKEADGETNKTVTTVANSTVGTNTLYLVNSYDTDGYIDVTPFTSANNARLSSGTGTAAATIEDSGNMIAFRTAGGVVCDITQNGGTVTAGASFMIDDDTQYFIYDASDAEVTSVALAQLETIANNSTINNFQTAAKSSTDPTLSYVFVTIP